MLCTATNQTPHERLFTYQRRASMGTLVPTWLMNLGRVLLKRQTKGSKYGPIVEKVDLSEANPEYTSFFFIFFYMVFIWFT